jgi:hypothetical protein
MNREERHHKLRPGEKANTDEEHQRHSDKHGKGRRIIRQEEAVMRQEAYEALCEVRRTAMSNVRPQPREVS